MNKSKFAKVATGVLVTSGIAITLPAFGSLLAPAILSLTTGVLDEDTVRKLGKKGIDYFVGVLGNLVGSAVQESPNLLKKSVENHDLLKLLAKAYSKAIDDLVSEIESNPEYENVANLGLREIKKRIEDAINQKTSDALEGLFPSKEYLEIANVGGKAKASFIQRFLHLKPKGKVEINEEFAAKQTSEEFILNISEHPEIAKEILVDEVEISLTRWFAETTPSLDQFPKSLAPFAFKKIAEKVPQHIGTLIKEDGYEKSWIAFQRSHLQAILKEVKDNRGLSNEDRELLEPLANELDELIKSDFPNKLAKSTETIICKLGESEENIKKCVGEERDKLQNYLLGMERRLKLHTTTVGKDGKRHTSDVVKKSANRLSNEMEDGFERLHSGIRGNRESEKDRSIRKQFEDFSPALKKIKKASLPKINEEWRIRQTLRSGLVLNAKKTKAHLTEELLNERVGSKPEGLIKKIFWRMKKDSKRSEVEAEVEEQFRKKFEYLEAIFDNNNFHRNPAAYIKDFLMNSFGNLTTNSISWHSSGDYIVTAGAGNLTKLWKTYGDSFHIETSYLPFIEDRSNAESIIWSGHKDENKRIIVSGGFGPRGLAFDGKYGKFLGDKNISIKAIDYSVSKYNFLRGSDRFDSNDNRTHHHLTSNYNFTPWRPTSNQFVKEREADKLILRNGNTGEIEKTIVYKPGYVTDFAWHPSGHFVAISFKEHNIKIFDIESGKPIGNSLSVQHIVGWNPEGTIFVGRKEKFRDEFRIWDALEQEEKPMPEEMKADVWFKRFFENISADGLRYIKVERDKDYSPKGHIYSVKSDKLLFTLPKNVTCAAWSPMDGGLLVTCSDQDSNHEDRGKTYLWKLDEKSID